MQVHDTPLLINGRGDSVTVNVDASGGDLKYGLANTNTPNTAAAGTSFSISTPTWVVAATRTAEIQLITVSSGGGGGSSGSAGSGGLPQVAAAVTTAGALAANKHTPVDASAGALTMTLPTGQAAGTAIAVEKRDSSANVVTVSGSIRGSAGTLSLRGQYETMTLAADSAGSWVPQNDHKTLAFLDARFSTSSAGVVLANAPTGVAATDRAGLITKIAACATAGGGIVLLLPGTYLTDQTIVVPGGVTLTGQGVNYTHPIATSIPARSAVIRATAAITAVVQVGDVAGNFAGDPSTYGPTHTSPSLNAIVVDGANTATNAVLVIGPRWHITNSQIWRGSAVALRIEAGGQNGKIDGESLIGMDDRGYGVYNLAHDVKVHDCQIRGATTARVFSQAHNFELKRNHIFPNGTSELGPDVIIDGGGASLYMGAMVDDNTFGSNSQDSSFVVVQNGVRAAKIRDNSWYQDNYGRAGTVSQILLDTTAAAISGVLIEGNASHIVSPSSGTLGFKALVQKAGANGLTDVSVIGNKCRGTLALLSGFTPEIRSGNNVRDLDGNMKYDDRAGQSTFNGTGAQTAFVIAHGLGATPSAVSFTPGSAAAAAAAYATADATNITVTFTTAPASGTSNVVLNWRVIA